jgi:geranylgeranyl pyrophosphate synthase
MEANKYFEKMKETSDIVNPFILQALEPLKATTHRLHSIVSELPIKRVEASSKARAFLLRQAYELAGGLTWERIAPVCAAVEMEICSMYYVNRIYDNKGGEKGQNNINEQIMAAKITRDLAAQLIERQRKEIPSSQLERVLHLMNESDLVFEEGEYIDVIENIYPKQKNTSFEGMMNLCDKRTYLINASYFEKIGMMGWILADGREEELISLGAFGKNYGMLLQIVNDIADFVPPQHDLKTCEKLVTDAYSDIKHGKLTYPIIYTLHKGAAEEKSKLIRIIEKANQAEPAELIELTQLLMRNGSMEFARKKGIEYYHLAKRALNGFDKEKRSYLDSMCVIAWTNRFYKALLDDYRKNLLK